MSFWSILSATRPLPFTLCDWLDDLGQRAFAAQLWTCIPKGPWARRIWPQGKTRFKRRAISMRAMSYPPNPALGNLWIQGNSRGRLLFAEDPRPSTGAEQKSPGEMGTRFCLLKLHPYAAAAWAEPRLRRMGAMWNLWVFLCVKMPDLSAGLIERGFQRENLLCSQGYPQFVWITFRVYRAYSLRRR